MNFVDEAEIVVHSGNGGDGCTSFRREKYVPRGGPNGGDGGNGGDVIIEGDENLSTLLDFKYKKSYIAENGKNGQGNKRSGRDGESIIIKVPLGTAVYWNDALLYDFVKSERAVVTKGGRGGKGNAHFATPTNRAPVKFEKGTRGEEKNLRLVLKLIADVGIVGYPNAGKSTLLSRISDASPKVAEYPFTTLTPNLGIVKLDFKKFVVADIPGVIDGAHKGRGLGLTFLRHIERTKLLLFLIDISRKNPKGDYNSLKNELNLYNPKLLKKPRLVVFNKIDLLSRGFRFRLDEELQTFYISAFKGEGVRDLVNRLALEI